MGLRVDQLDWTKFSLREYSFSSQESILCTVHVYNNAWRWLGFDFIIVFSVKTSGVSCVKHIGQGRGGGGGGGGEEVGHGRIILKTLYL